MDVFMSLFAIVPILIYLGLFFFVIYAIITVLRLMREKNVYLKDIRDEMRKGNKIDS